VNHYATIVFSYSMPSTPFELLPSLSASLSLSCLLPPKGSHQIAFVNQYSKTFLHKWHSLCFFIISSAQPRQIPPCPQGFKTTFEGLSKQIRQFVWDLLDKDDFCDLRSILWRGRD